ncbi:lysine-specific demethylase 5B [Anopheles sinensis]|uniref:Lysine-specific demethylase 5B n=1 Tax=Anopheles sinensis TaxID=74873 RepID=A0A084WNV0_ANOSI|nr:lysine-specific demethylase 5B [Anopheles sinensis]
MRTTTLLLDVVVVLREGAWPSSAALPTARACCVHIDNIGHEEIPGTARNHTIAIGAKPEEPRGSLKLRLLTTGLWLEEPRVLPGESQSNRNKIHTLEELNYISADGCMIDGTANGLNEFRRFHKDLQASTV